MPVGVFKRKEVDNNCRQCGKHLRVRTTAKIVICKECRTINNKKYRKDNPWTVIVQRIRLRCKESKFYIGKNIKCFISMQEVKTLWYRDKAWLLKKSSIDRIDNKGNYTFANCRFIELKENLARREFNRELMSRVKRGKPSWTTGLKKKIEEREKLLAKHLLRIAQLEKNNNSLADEVIRLGGKITGGG